MSWGKTFEVVSWSVGVGLAGAFIGDVFFDNLFEGKGEMILSGVIGGIAGGWVGSYSEPTAE